MGQIAKLVDAMARNPRDVRFGDLYRVCVHFFGEPRIRRGSHAVFRTPWKGDPRINIQNAHGKAKEYQVRQVLSALEKLKDEGGSHG